MTLTKLDLFNNKKEAYLTFSVLFLLFCLHVGLKYFEFQSFLGYKSSHEGRIVLIYEKINKHNKPYTIAKIKTKDFIIYSKIAKKYKLHQNDFIRFKTYKKRIKFKDFLSNKFYAPTYKIKILSKKETTLKDNLAKFITNQHESLELKQLYSALFLATPLSKDLRKKIQNWGISHLVAISGFHLGVIYASLFFIFKIFYGFFHERFFPYRNINFDLGIVIFAFLAFYTYLLNFSPSFLRSFTMGILGFYLYMKHLKLISFTNLALSGAILLVVFPSLLFSLSFWFSVMGVFYIFLYLHHFKFKKLDFIFINAWVYFAMVIPTHFWFGYISYQQILSIFISMIFILFYPLSLILHIFNLGRISDSFMRAFLNMDFKGDFIVAPLWLFIFYIFLSLLSIRYKFLAIFTVFLGSLYFFFI